MSRLPSELVSHIARCILDGEIISRTPGELFKEEDIIDAKSIIPLTHVCRYWRESIISTPENWTLISSRSEGLASSSLQRAKAAPLEIRLNMNQVRKAPGFSALIAPHIQNAKTLLICNGLSIKELAQKIQPNLRSLALIRSGQHRDWDWSIDPFGPSIPALTYLLLEYTPLYPPFLHLRTLTDLVLRVVEFNIHLDTLLDFLEENHSLERLDLSIQFTEPTLRSSRRQVPIRNRLQSLTIYSTDVVDCNALISNLALQRGANLDITIYYPSAEFNDLPSVISMTHRHLPNLEFPTLMEYHPKEISIRLLGPNGSFSFEALGLNGPFAECSLDCLAWFPPVHLTNIRTFRYSWSESLFRESETFMFSPSTLPALETFVVEYEVDLSYLLSALLLDPSSSPSLKILAFLDCDLDEYFMEELILFASNRKKTTSAWLHRVVIVNSKGIFPKFASIDALRKHVPVVDVQISEKLPAGLI